MKHFHLVLVVPLFLFSTIAFCGSTHQSVKSGTRSSANLVGNTVAAPETDYLAEGKREILIMPVIRDKKISLVYIRICVPSPETPTKPKQVRRQADCYEYYSPFDRIQEELRESGASDADLAFLKEELEKVTQGAPKAFSPIVFSPDAREKTDSRFMKLAAVGVEIPRHFSRYGSVGLMEYAGPKGKILDGIITEPKELQLERKPESISNILGLYQSQKSNQNDKKEFDQRMGELKAKLSPALYASFEKAIPAIAKADSEDYYAIRKKMTVDELRAFREILDPIAKVIREEKAACQRAESVYQEALKKATTDDEKDKLWNEIYLKKVKPLKRGFDNFEGKFLDKLYDQVSATEQVWSRIPEKRQYDVYKSKE